MDTFMEIVNGLLGTDQGTDFAWPDAAMVLFVGASAILAFVRGFTREMLASLSWVGAIIATLVFFPEAVVQTQVYVGDETLSKIIGPVALFVICLAAFMLCVVVLSKFVLKSSVGIFDRLLGLFFGTARGIVVCAALLIVYIWFVKGAIVGPLMFSKYDREGTFVEHAVLYDFTVSVSDLMFGLVMDNTSAQETEEKLEEIGDAAVDAATLAGDSMSDNLDN